VIILNWSKLSIFFLTKKNGEAYGLLDHLIYPLARCLSKNLSSASCCPSANGYTLQLSVGGASGNRSIV